MKIIQVSAIDSTMNGLLRELNTTIVNEGHDLICVCSHGDKVAQMIEEGFDVRTIHIDRKISPFRNLKSIINMYKLFKREKPDIVHVHTPVASVLGRIAAKLARVPAIIYTAHGFYFHENMSGKQYKLFYTIEKVMARFFTDYIFTQSEEDGTLAVENNFLPANRITIIGNGVDVQGKFNPENIDNGDVQALKKEFDIKYDDLVVSFIGRLVEEKGVFDLLEAFNVISQSNIKLLVIGGTDISERDQHSQQRFKGYENNKQIYFTGFRTDIPNLLNISDIYCLPSYREGMPRSIIEAMAMECAIIATNIRGSREEVEHGVNGYLVKLGDSKGIKNSISKLANDKELLRNFRFEARNKSQNLYDEKIVVKNQLDVFENIQMSRDNEV